MLLGIVKYTWLYFKNLKALKYLKKRAITLDNFRILIRSMNNEK